MCLGEPFALCKTKPKHLSNKTCSSAVVFSDGMLDVALSVYILLSTQKMIYLYKAIKLLLSVKRSLYLPKPLFFMGHS